MTNRSNRCRPARLRRLRRAAPLLPLALLGTVCTQPAMALDIGFEGILSTVVTDNFDRDLPGEEINGRSSLAGMKVFGLHSTNRAQGAFVGDINTDLTVVEGRREDRDTFVGFNGSAVFKVTPQAIRWLFSDTLGSVLECRELVNQGETFNADIRRNVFATGPAFEYRVGRQGSVGGKVLFISQQQTNGLDIDDALNYTLDYSTLVGGSHRLGATVTAYRPVPGQATQEFNRTTYGAFWHYSKGTIGTRLDGGLVRYTSPVAGDDSAVFIRFTGERRSGNGLLTFGISKDLVDFAFFSTQSLQTTGRVRADFPQGLSDRTQVSLTYDHQLNFSNRFSVTVGGESVSQRSTSVADTEGLLSQDDGDVRFAGVSYNTLLNTRWSAGFQATYMEERFDNQDEFTEAYKVGATIEYRLSKQFYIQSVLTHTTSCGFRDDDLGADPCLTPFEFDENELVVALRWVPPSKVSKNAVIELQSQLE